MTPAEAAALLDVPVDADLEQVERAFRYHARLSHPDRLASATPAELAAAAARFDSFTRARAVLREADDLRNASHRAGTPSHATTPTPEPADVPQPEPRWAADEPYPQGVPAGPWLFWVWTGLYAVGAAISFVGGPLPYSALDLWLRLIPLGLAAAGFARTGRTAFLAVVVALGGATAALTIAFASFGPLVAMIVLMAPVIGLVALGRRRQRDRVEAGT